MNPPSLPSSTPHFIHQRRTPPTNSIQPIQPAAGRYHLYVGNACPWCHRVLLTLAIRGLSQSVGVTRLLDIPERATRGGWVMPAAGDPVFGAKDLW